MPITSVTLFLFAVFFSLFLLGFSYSLKAKYNARHIDVYFYFMIVVVSYGFVNWIGPSFVIYFNQVGSTHSNQAIQLFILCAIPFSFLKLLTLLDNASTRLTVNLITYSQHHERFESIYLY